MDEMYQPPPINGGPSWKWLAGILLSIVGIGLAALMTVIWNELDTLDRSIGQMSTTLTEIKDGQRTAAEQLAADSVQIGKLWDKYAGDHETLMRDDYKLAIDDDWIAAHADANNAVRKLHRRDGRQ